jgi:hypothetical protein
MEENGFCFIVADDSLKFFIDEEELKKRRLSSHSMTQVQKVEIGSDLGCAKIAA